MLKMPENDNFLKAGYEYSRGSNEIFIKIWGKVPELWSDIRKQTNKQTEIFI